MALGTWRRRCSVRPGLPEEQPLSWLQCLFSQPVCDREAFRRGGRVPPQGLVRGLAETREPPSRGNGESVCGAQSTRPGHAVTRL